MFKHLLHNKYALYGGAVIGLILIFMLLRGSSGSAASTTAVTTTGPTDAQVQQQTTLALAQIQANSQSNSDASNFALQTLKIQGDAATAAMQVDLQKYAITQDSANTQSQITAQEAATSQTNDVNAQIAKWTLDNALAMQTANNSFQLDYASNANSSALAAQTIQAGVLTDQINANQNVSIATLQSQAAQLASYLGAQVSINDSNNSTQVADQQIQAGVAKKQSSNNLIGSIVGGVLGIFSDRRLKTDILLIGREPDGVGVYSYRYKDGVTHTIGYMADEIRKIRPGAIGPKIAGYDTVIYGNA